MFTMVAEATIIVGFALGLLALCILVKLIKLPITLLVKFVSNSVVGALMLGIANAFGIGLQITVLKAFFCGVVGVPGVIIVILWDKFMAG